MRRADAGVLLIGMLAVAACEQAKIVQPEFSSAFPPPHLSVNHPQGETITLGNVDTLYGGASDTTSQQKQVPYVTIMKVTGSYTVSVTKNRYPVSDPSPAVLYARHGLGITVKSGSNVSSNLAFSGTTDGELSMFVTLDRNARISRAYHSGGTNGSQSGTWPEDGTPWQCGTQYSDPCYKYVGTGGSVSITPLQGTLVLNADSTTVAIGSSVKFWIDSSVVEGKSLGIEVDTVKWVPDGDSDGGEYTETRAAYACAFTGWPLTCSKQILGSGTLEVVAHVNGFRKVQSKHVKVREGAPKLTASRSGVVKGDTVSFQASWTDGHVPVQIDQWKFVPDTTPDVTGACGSWLNPCKRAIQQSGTMTVKLVRNGVIRTARARVNVIPCPTGDDRLDDPNVRKGFSEMWRQSHADSAPGAGINPNDPIATGWRKERASWVILRANGRFDVVQAKLNWSTQCSINPVLTQYDSIKATLSPGDSIVAFAHTHPSMPRDTVYGNCDGKDAFGNTVRVQRYPGDSLGVLATKGADSTNGGGSEGDWSFAAQGIVDVYTMNKAGEIWRLPQGWTSAKKYDDMQARRKTWSQACGWT